MKCPSCNADVREGANFCGACRHDLSAANGQEPESTRPKSNALPAAILGAAILVAAAIIAAALLAPRSAPATIYDVQIQVIAPEYTEADSPIPVRVAGTESGGAAVDQVAYVDYSGDGLKLAPGNYELSLEASPLCESGVIYEEESQSAKLSIDEQGNQDSGGKKCSLKLKPCARESVTADQIAAASKAARESGFDAKLVERYEAASRDWVASSDESGGARAAFSDKLQELVDEYGKPEIVSAGQAQYLSGLAFARLVEFGDDGDYLLLSYYDPALDEDPQAPGSMQACYPVEVWEYRDRSLNRVYQGQAQLQGQNLYCSSILLGERAGECYVVELDSLSAPNGYSERKIFGVSNDGEFGQLVSLRSEQQMSGGAPTVRYLIDGEEVSEDEYNAMGDEWELDQESIALSGGFSGRDVKPAYRETLGLYEELAGGKGEATEERDEAPSDTVVETTDFSFTIPDYWVGKVAWEVEEGNYGYERATVFLKGGSADTTPLVRISRYPSDLPRNGGDYASPQIYTESDDGRVVVFGCVNWPAHAYDAAHRSHGLYSGLNNLSEDELALLIDVGTGGEGQYPEVANADSSEEVIRLVPDYVQTLTANVQFK